MEDDQEQLDYGDLKSPESIKQSKPEQEQLEEDLYGDLVPGSFPEDSGYQDKLQELTEKTQQQASRIAELEAELQTRTQERDVLLEEKTILVRNISCMFKTAQLEVDRKDTDIKKLRARLAQQSSGAAGPRPRTPAAVSQAPRPGPPDMPGPPPGPPPGAVPGLHPGALPGAPPMPHFGPPGGPPLGSITIAPMPPRPPYRGPPM